MMTAGEFCNRVVVVARKDESLIDAARRMREHHVGDVVVVEDQQGRTVPVGIVTDRDIVVEILARSPQDIQRLRVGDVMGAPVITAQEQEDLVDAIKQMRSFGIRRMPVVDDQGALVGIIAFDDVVEFLADEMVDLATLLRREQDHERQRRT